MLVKQADKEEIEIEQLNNIVSIEYVDFAVPQSTGKEKIYPGFFVTYQGGKVIYLSSIDSHFDQFCRRLKEVYVEEKDHIVSDGIMGPQKILISPVTKELLLNGELEKTSKFYEKFKGEEGYDDSLLFEEDELHSIFPVFEYHLRELLNHLRDLVQGLPITLGDVRISTGMNGVYYLSAMINNKPTICPIFYHQENQVYTMEIGNIIPKSIPIHMEVSFNSRDRAINVQSSVPEYRYFDSTTYGVSNDIPYCERNIMWKGKCVDYHREHIPPVEGIPENIIPKEEDTKWYVTPWGGYIGIYRKEEKISNDDRIAEDYFYYVNRSDQSYYEHEQDAKRYYKYQAAGHYYSDIIFDSMNQKTIGIKNGKVLLLEHSFFNPHHTGFYRDHLNHKHFYTVGRGPSWKDVDGRVFINRENGVIEKADLLEQKILEKRLNKNGNI